MFVWTLPVWTLPAGGWAPARALRNGISGRRPAGAWAQGPGAGGRWRLAAGARAAPARARSWPGAGARDLKVFFHFCFSIVFRIVKHFVFCAVVMFSYVFMCFHLFSTSSFFNIVSFVFICFSHFVLCL